MIAGFLLSVVPGLLNAYWALAAGAALTAMLPISQANAFRAAVMMTACRGKLWQSRPAARLGALTDASVPQKWFLHFYIIGAAWNAIILAADMTACSRGTLQLDVQQAATVVTLLLLQIHLLRRVWETKFLLKYPDAARMHLIAYAFGISYYLVLPISMLPPASLERVWLSNHGPVTVNIHELAAVVQHAVSLCTWASVLGATTVAVGNLLQFSAHRTLSRLTIANAGKDEAYRIPRGGLFELVSCPHYFAEVVIYGGFVLLKGPRSVTVWLVFIWVVRTYQHDVLRTVHRGPGQTFGDTTAPTCQKQVRAGVKPGAGGRSHTYLV